MDGGAPASVARATPTAVASAAPPKTPVGDRRPAARSLSALLSGQRRNASTSDVTGRSGGRSNKEGTPPSDAEAAESELWLSIYDNVLPLFAGDGLQDKIEPLNQAVVRLQRTVGPEGLLVDIRSLLSAGMTTIANKLAAVPEDRFITRLVELWSFFFGTVLPYLQGIFEPLQVNDALLKTLDWIDAATTPASLLRDMVLISFRQEVLLPNVDRLRAPLQALFDDRSTDLRSVDLALKITQMVSVLRGPYAPPQDLERLDVLLAAVQQPFRTFHLSLTSLRGVQ